MLCLLYQGCNHNSGQFGHPYANGWRDPNKKFRTIMSYPCSGAYCPRVLRWSTSNGSIRYNNHAVGNSDHDNVRQINEKRVKVANYRTVCSHETFYKNNGESNHCSFFEKFTNDKERLTKCRIQGTASSDCKVSEF